jgi:hypothetical protein
VAAASARARCSNASERLKNPEIEAEPGEETLTIARASFRGAAATSTRATFALGSGRMRDRAYRAWHDAATSAGFPSAPADMVIVVTDRRVLFGKPTFWGRVPTQFWSALDLGAISQIVATRHGIVTGVAFALHEGAVVEIEALRGRQLRRFADTVEAHLPRR